jgi:KEOPS complex subunit Pcc1
VTDDSSRRDETAETGEAVDRGETVPDVGGTPDPDGAVEDAAEGDRRPARGPELDLDLDLDLTGAGEASHPDWSARPHGVTLSLPGGPRGALVADAIEVEEGEMPDDRSRARVRTTGREGGAGGDREVVITAADLIALRAASNTWLRLVDVAERVIDVADGRGTGSEGGDGRSDPLDDLDAGDEGHGSA